MRIKTRLKGDFAQAAKRVVDIATSENPRADIIDIYIKALKRFLEGFALVNSMNPKEIAIFEDVVDFRALQKEIGNIPETLTKYRALFLDYSSGITREEFIQLIKIAAQPESTFKKVKPKAKK